MTGGWEAAERILCVRLDAMGDVLMTTPALRALREGGPPGRRLTLWTSASGAAVAEMVPEVDEVVVYAAPWMKATARRGPEPDREMIGRIAAGGYDAAVIFTVYSQNPLPAALACHLAGIPLRLAHCRENPYQLLTDWVRETEPDEGTRHEVQRQLDLVATVGCRTAEPRLSLRVPPEAEERAEAALRSVGVAPGEPWVALHPGASAASRRYPAERFARVAGELARRLGLRVVVTGSREEAGLAETVRAGAGAAGVSLAGRLSLAELAALVSQAPLLVSNNTGPAHVAAAVGTPVVDLYALTNPQHTPWAVPSRVLWKDVPCRFCYRSVCPEGHHRCLAEVEPEEVVEAAVSLLAEVAAAPAR